MRSFGLAWVLVLQQASPWVDSAPHKAQSIAVADGVQLEVLDFGGAGRPLVFLPGLGNTAHVVDEFAPKLTAMGRVYAVTRRGYGVSSRPESGYDVEQLGKDVLAVIKALGLQKPVMIGHSYGGQELSYLASEHRDEIGALIYLDAAYRYAYDVPGEFERDFPSLPPPPSPPRVTRLPFVLPEAERRQPRGSPVAAKAIAAGSKQFTDIRLPALAIFASPHDVGADAPDEAFERFDEAVTERQARAFERGVPGARVLRWRRASHYLFLTREADVIREISQFVTGLQ